MSSLFTIQDAGGLLGWQEEKEEMEEHLQDAGGLLGWQEEKEEMEDHLQDGIMMFHLHPSFIAVHRLIYLKKIFNYKANYQLFCEKKIKLIPCRKNCFM